MLQTKQFNSTLIRSLIGSDYSIRLNYLNYIFYGGIDMPSEEDLMKALPVGFDTLGTSLRLVDLNSALESLGATRLCTRSKYRPGQVTVPERVKILGDEGYSYTLHNEGTAKFAVLTSSSISADPAIATGSYIHFCSLFSVGEYGSGSDLEMPSNSLIVNSGNGPRIGDLIVGSSIEVPFEAKPVQNTIEIVDHNFSNVSGLINKRVQDYDYLSVQNGLNLISASDQEMEFQLAENSTLEVRGRFDVDGFTLKRLVDGLETPIALTHLDPQQIGLYAGTYKLISLGDNTLTEFRAVEHSGGFALPEILTPSSIEILGPDSVNELSSVGYSFKIIGEDSSELITTSYKTFTCADPDVNISGVNVEVGDNIDSDRVVTLSVSFEAKGVTVSATKDITLVNSYISPGNLTILEDSTYTALTLESPQMTDGTTNGGYVQFYIGNYTEFAFDDITVVEIYVSPDSRYDSPLVLTDLLNSVNTTLDFTGGGWFEITFEPGHYRFDETNNTLVYEFKPVFRDSSDLPVNPAFPIFEPTDLNLTLGQTTIGENGNTTLDAVAIDSSLNEKIYPVTVDTGDAELSYSGGILTSNGLALQEDKTFTITVSFIYDTETISKQIDLTVTHNP